MLRFYKYKEMRALHGRRLRNSSDREHFQKAAILGKTCQDLTIDPGRRIGCTKRFSDEFRRTRELRKKRNPVISQTMGR